MQNCPHTSDRASFDQASQRWWQILITHSQGRSGIARRKNYKKEERITRKNCKKKELLRKWKELQEGRKNYKKELQLLCILQEGRLPEFNNSSFCFWLCSRLFVNLFTVSARSSLTRSPSLRA